jgi:protein SCO1
LSILRIIRIVAFLGIGVLVALIAQMTLFQKPKNTLFSFGGSFVLQATTGQKIERNQLIGKPYGLFFGYTNCPDFCPTAMQDITVLLAKFGSEAKDFRVYFISVDPVRDTPDLLKLYVSAFDPRIIGLSGNESEIASVTKSFNIHAKKNGSGDNYTFDHTSSILLFDAKGNLAGTINSSEPEADQKLKLERLLKS